MKTKFFLLPGAFALLAGGCNVGPDYQKPVANAPAQWSEPLAGGESHQGDPATAWWKTFHDPELDSLVQRAAAENLDLQIAAARVRQARAQQGIADADFWPSVNATGSYARQRESENQPLIGSLPLPPNFPFESNYYQAGFDASWEIDVFGGTRRANQAATAEVAAAVYSQRDVLITLQSEVARNYLEVRGDQLRISLAQQNIQAQQDGLALTRERYEKGLTSELDVEQAATLLATTQAEVPNFESAREAAIHRLGVLLAQPPGALESELAQAAPLPAVPPAVPVGLPSDLLERRPDIQMAERELAAQTARIGVATADLFPKFYLTGTAGLESISANSWFTGPSQYWAIGPTMQWKLFEGNRIRSNIHLQTALQEQAFAQYRKTVLTSFEEVENALVAYANEQTRRQSLAQAVASSQEQLDLSNQRYKNGLASFLDVVDAERSLYQTQDELARSDQTVDTNLIALYKALGGGWQTETTPDALSSAPLANPTTVARAP
jgi:NodT family efflux transporter outer membrane factor (OMF) lipoprotein